MVTPGAPPQAADWWKLAPDAELAEMQEDLDAALAMLERKRALIRAHRDQNLKIWAPPETKLGGWLATWVGPPQPGEHREAVEGDLYDWLEASLGGPAAAVAASEPGPP